VWGIDLCLMPLRDFGSPYCEFKTFKFWGDAFESQPLGLSGDHVQKLPDEPLRFVSVAEFISDTTWKHKAYGRLNSRSGYERILLGVSYGIQSQIYV
jgi:hypothetical protein